MFSCSYIFYPVATEKLFEFIIDKQIRTVVKQQHFLYKQEMLHKCPRMSLIMTLIPGCDLEHSQGTLTLGVGT